MFVEAEEEAEDIGMTEVSQPLEDRIQRKKLIAEILTIVVWSCYVGNDEHPHHSAMNFILVFAPSCSSLQNQAAHWKDH